MTLPASGPITLQQIQDEFLAPRNMDLLHFLRGAGWVGNTAINANVPTTAPISLTSLYGASRTTTPPALTAVSSNVSGATHAGTTNDLVGFGSITPSGGTPPYTYSTAFLSGSSFNLSAATTSSPQFNRIGNPPGGGGAISGIYRCTVNDSAGQSTLTDFTVTDNRV